MSVIIRLQNLPWSANALDIRQFFKGLSIPEGGVHIVGGENGDAFIAFSTDEDARQAMQNDRGKLNEVQIRLLLSSRAEMQKVIETARQQSLLALQKAGAIPTIPTTITATSVGVTASSLPAPQPPVITTNSLKNILATQLASAAPSFQTYQKDAGITLVPNPKIKSNETSSIISRRDSNETSSRDRRRSSSRDRRRSRSRDRNDRNDRSDRSSNRRRRERSRSRDRERDRRNNGGRARSSRRSRSRERSRDRSWDRDRNRNNDRNRSNRNSRDGDPNVGGGNRHSVGRSASSSLVNKNAPTETNEVKPQAISPWNIPPVNAYETTSNLLQSSSSVFLNQAQSNKAPQLNAFPIAIETGIKANIPNAYTTARAGILNAESSNSNSLIGAVSAAAIAAPPAIPLFQNYNTSSTTANNYSVNILSNPGGISGQHGTNNPDIIKPFALQNPYTAALHAATSNSNSQDSSTRSPLANAATIPSNTSGFPGFLLDKKPAAETSQPPLHGQSNVQQQTLQQQEPIAFANTNPYAQMYPGLFAQAAAVGTGITNPSLRPNNQRNSQDQNPFTQQQQQQQRPQLGPVGNQDNFRKKEGGSSRGIGDIQASCSMKISNMCPSTTYSDLRKFFSGLFIPHNGIKMINDSQGIRVGVAYIQFSRNASIPKAMVRNNTLLKNNRIHLEVVSDQEFNDCQDSFRPPREFQNRCDRNEQEGGGGNRGYDDYNSPSQSGGGGGTSMRSFSGTFSVLYIEDIPASATEVDIMKMFSAYTIYDIVLTASPENRREFIAFVKFSREEEAKAALEESSRHMIGHRKVRIRPENEEEMTKVKEKIRLANEQLKKEEESEALKEAEAEKLEQEQNSDNDDCDDGVDDDDRDNARDENNYDDMEEQEEEEEIKQPCRPNIPSIFDLPPPVGSFAEGPTDPRLRRQMNNKDDGDNFSENNRKMNTNYSSNDDDLQSSSGGNNTAMPNLSGPPFNFNQQSTSFQMNSMENNFVLLKNCDYHARINDVGQFLSSANLKIKHIEPLRNDRNQPSGEFIVEFTNLEDASTAVKRFNNSQFRSRNLRIRPIRPQEIADRIGKPFMNYFPGGGGGGSGGGPMSGPPMMRGNFDFSGRGGPMNMMSNFQGMNSGGNMGQNRNMPPNRFAGGNNNMNNRGRGGVGGGNSDRSHNMRGGNEAGSGAGMRRNFNNQSNNMDSIDDDKRNRRSNRDNITVSDNEDDVISCDSSSNNNPDGVSTDTGGNREGNGGIPEKFSKPNCVISMENVPYKADLHDIIDFFKDFNVVPDDIIRRFNDDGSPTGDARVAFPTAAKARAAFDAKKQRCIFNRTIYLSII